MQIVFNNIYLVVFIRVLNNFDLEYERIKFKIHYLDA
jgi:hypothetical protein